MCETMQRNICLENVELFKTKCRICLMDNETKLPLFETDGTTKYCDLIAECTGLSINYNKFLSDDICKQCIDELMTASNFITKVKYSIEKFNHFLFIDASTTESQTDVISENVVSKNGSPFSEKPCDETAENSISIVNAETKKLENELSFGLKFKKSRGWNNEQEKKHNEEKPKLRNKISYKNITVSELKHLNIDVYVEETSQSVDYESKYEVIQPASQGAKKQMLQCKECGVLSQNRSAFIIHYRKHIGLRPYQCKQCFKLFTQIGTLNAHMKRGHTKTKKVKEKKAAQHGLYICDVCKKRYTLRSSLVTHLRAHNTESQLQCYFCPQRFVKSGERAVHIRVHHTGERPYFCDKCGKTFAASTNLNTHMLTHSDEKCFKCEYCEKLFKSHDNLKRHILAAHTEKKEIICDYCGEAFGFKTKLLNHIQVWHINKEYGNCEICHENIKDMAKHMKSHFGNKPFGCTMCHKAFYNEKTLINHYSKHDADEARFKCPHNMCDSIFAKQSMLDFHIVKCHTEKTPFACKRCPKEFYRRGDLGKHMSKVHNLWLLPVKQRKKRRKGRTP